MRIVGGALSGRRFAGPKGDATRPTAERVREAVFSALEARGAVEGARVLDLYAGTGALAFEALSRGAANAVSVERDARIVRAIEADARALELEGRHRALVLDLGKKSAAERVGGPFELVLADPPWADLARAADVLAGLVGAGVLAERGRVVLVHAERDRDPEIAGLALETRYRYGDTAVVIYLRAA
jgi:16S rRNA (guanine966-N2)-methyltransferase